MPQAGFRSGGEGLQLHSVAKVSQAFDQASSLLVVGAPVEMFATEVVIHRPILKHVVDGREDGSRDGHAEEMLEFMARHGVLSVAMTDRIIGCPHQEGIDYHGQWCPVCEFWKGLHG
jgi:hypothetical protein